MFPVGLRMHVKMYKNGAGDTSVWYRHLVWLHVTFLCFAGIACFFLQIQRLCQPHVEHVYWCRFLSSICSPRVSVSHLGNSCNISEFFIIIVFVMVICEWRSSVLVLQNIMTPWRLRWWLSFFIKKELFLGGCTTWLVGRKVLFLAYENVLLLCFHHQNVWVWSFLLTFV